ncbi:X-linked retinitis pigmentosa GTPase regulator-interacting protein 1-like [Eucalyptus grandis]|uniref:X-linked retinitis pigmentosa GTPase regulator-interacting protein 1-like n=1 Tax=Eucalyptus grandis TaxID=71139 RepID=UPI00192EA256|nr:X-linked retinitis pigmentosa GTPase regulator-interacting protein 1-like [Eucalyptus grandis]
MHFGIFEEITEIGYHFLIHPHSEGLEYVLVKSQVWVDVGTDDLVPHEYQSWYRHYHDRQREGPVSESDIPLFILEASFGKGIVDPKDGSVMDAKNPKLEGDPESPIYSTGGANWSEEEGEIVEHEEESEEHQEWEELEEELEEEFMEGELKGEEPEEEDPEEDPKEEESEEEDPEEDPEYDPDED